MKFDRDLNCINVVFTGEFNFSALSDLAEEVAQYLKKHEGACVLNDLRNATVISSPLSVYQMPQAAVEAGVKQGIKRALLVNDPGKFRFLETVFLNSGNTVQLFTDIDEARSWLLQ